MFKRLFAISILCLASLTFIGPTYAGPVSQYFSDTETSQGNSFSATTLDFSLRDTSGVVLSSPLFNVSSWVPGSSETKTVRVKKDGLADFKYQLSAVQTGGDAGLCTALQVEAKHGGTTLYSGGLLGLTNAPQTISGAGQDDLDIKVSLSDGASALQNKICNFNLKVRGWQTDSDGTWCLGDEEILANSVTSGSWDSPGSVVINEIMWMGSKSNSDDEWIELKNTTDSDINLENWKINGAGSGSDAITLFGIIPANDYFLISHYNSSSSAINDTISVNLVVPSISLNNSGEQLTLLTSSGTTIDQTPTGAWAAGNHGGDKQSMERNDTPSTGWHTCTDSACNDTTYWDVEGNNYGTPKAANLSQNDPSSPEYVPPVATVPEATQNSTPTTVAVVEPITQPASPSATIVESPFVESTRPATPSGEIVP